MGSSWRNHEPKFVRVLYPSDLLALSIPTAFLKLLESDLKGHHLETVVLMTEHEPQRHWVATVESSRVLTDGWKEFCLHLNFQVGDFVVFTYRSNLLFHVSVFDRVTNCERIPTSSQHVKPIPKNKGSKRNRVELTDTCKTEPKECDAAIPSIKDESSCVVKLTTYNVKYSIIFLPVDFVRKHRLQARRCAIMIIDAKRRVWPASLTYKKCDGQVYIKRGWKSFLTANHYKPGNLLCVQLIKGGDCPTLKCCRTNRVGAERNSARRTKPKTQAEDITASPCPSVQGQCQYPSCRVRLNSFSFRRSIIYLPAGFVREGELKYRRCEVKVVDEEERKWKASLGFRRTNAKAYIHQGWRDVCTSNCLMPGDFVCFQLLEAGECPILRCYRCKQGWTKSVIT